MKKTNDGVITCLKGPDRVRKRPAVIFNSDDAEGVTRAVEMLLDIFITEAALGYSKELSVKIHNDDSICILSKDRGFVMDETLIDGKPVWEYDFCELYSAPREKKEVYSYGLIEEKIITSYMANLTFRFQNTVQQNGTLLTAICVACNMYRNT